jgi:Cysteine rich repeat
MIEARARDFRLDTRLRDACAEDIEMSCAWDKDQSKAVANADGHVIRCLQVRCHVFLLNIRFIMWVAPSWTSSADCVSIATPDII